MKIAILAGTHSGCGKTTLMLALLQYFRKQKQCIAAFKTGPDFLDPMWHQAVTGQASYNLDTQMVGIEESRLLLQKQAMRADIGLIEGVMGMFDGRSGVGQAGSTVHLAKALACPVLLVLDASGMAGSVVPLVSGFSQFSEQQGVTLCGIIANKVGSGHHADLIGAALQEYKLPPLVAWMEKDWPQLAERHLGLTVPVQDVPDYLPLLHVQNDLLQDAFHSHLVKPETGTATTLLAGKKIAVARDSACCFIYPANLDWLLEQGAELAYFSPVAGEAIPEQTDAVWLPGGYPELFVKDLAVSRTWPSLHRFITSGKPVLAECGGAMLLGRELVDLDGRCWPMAGILPYVSVMQRKLAALGYREESCGARGHEFHYSVRHNSADLSPGYKMKNGDQGIRYKKLRASYIHWYFASAPLTIAKWFL